MKRDRENSGNRINHQIRCPVVRVIRDNKNLGVFSTDEARKIAVSAGLDLVEIAPQSKPPVCQIMDYGKFRYEKSLKDKEKKKHQRQSQEKELRLSSSIGDHDLLNKINSARKFLKKGLKVRFTLRYKARENSHKELGLKVIERVIAELSDIGSSGKPRIEGKFLNCSIEPKNEKK
ncbi:MAG: translation initiation factor IF-3 [Crenarchaeota archaeon]|nr:MAG: translation initiation factor IF-3 [Thermoproteota archaeon]